MDKYYSDSNPNVYLMGNSYGCMVGLELLLREKINYKAAHFLGPFFGFVPDKQFLYDLLIYFAMITILFFPSFSTPTKIWKKSDF